MKSKSVFGGHLTRQFFSIVGAALIFAVLAMSVAAYPYSTNVIGATAKYYTYHPYTHYYAGSYSYGYNGWNHYSVNNYRNPFYHYQNNHFYYPNYQYYSPYRAGNPYSYSIYPYHYGTRYW